MIDYIKALVIGANISALKDNLLLEFRAYYNPVTGETESRKNKMNRCWATYQGLTFIIYENHSVYLEGSLHKYWNGGRHNYNDFDLKTINEVLTDLADKFNIYPDQLKLQNLEIGVNIDPPGPTDAILGKCFLHSTSNLTWHQRDELGSYKQAQHQQYIIKIYNKAKQYRGQGYEVAGEILRFEIKYVKGARLKILQMKTLANVLQNLDVFVEELIKEWRKVLFYDSTINSPSTM